MLLYADENFAYPVVLELRQLGHDVITVQEDGRQGADDLAVLRAAHGMGRVVLTHNRRHFERLHRQGHAHSGIVACKRDDNFLALAGRIHAAVIAVSPACWCIRINRPP